jgi:hypothetical protein
LLTAGTHVVTQRQNRHKPCEHGHAGHPAAKGAGTMTGLTTEHRRADAGTVKISQRDITGLVLCAEHGGAPYDLLAAALAVQPARLRAIVARWRAAGYAETGPLGVGPAWCWLTPAGMTAAGLPYPATQPPLARLAHLRAVLAARLWFSPAPPGTSTRHGGNPNAASAGPAPPPAPTGPTPRSGGPPSPPAPTPGRSGPSRSS